MKQVTVVGVGTGRDTVTAEGLRAIQNAELLLGARRLLDAFSDLKKPVEYCYQADKIKAVIEQSDCSRFAVLLSGDVGFYSAAKALRQFQEAFDLVFLPGVSSVSAFCAKLQIDWQDAALVSLHGVQTNLADTVRRSKKTLCLAGDNLQDISHSLVKAGFGGCAISVGSNLGSKKERIVHTTARELAVCGANSLSLLLIWNPQADDRVATGIPDEAFDRGNVPMTKAEVRAVTLSKLCLSPEDICVDIGCGTGSVTVEMALSAYRGHIYAIDKNPQAVALTQQNCERFHLSNVTVLSGPAEDLLPALPAPTVVFIGGSGGSMHQIIEATLQKNPSVRFVINAVSPQSVCEALDALQHCGVQNIEGVQVSCARLKPVDRLHLMVAQNPVTVLWGGQRYV